MINNNQGIYIPWGCEEFCVNEFEGNGDGGGNDTIVSASVRVNDVTTIAAAAERPRLPVADISEEVMRSRRPSSSDDRFEEGVIEPTAVQFSVGSAVAVDCSVSILCKQCPDHDLNVDEAKS